MPPCRPLLLLCLLLAACAPQAVRRQAPAGSAPVQPRTAGGAEAVIQASPDSVLQRVEAALRERGFAITRVTGASTSVEANVTGPMPRDWADCPRITVRDPFAEALRSRRADAVELETRATVSAAPLAEGSSTLTVRALQFGTYLNSFNNTPQQGACRSTGVLEQELVEAARGGSR
jgi:hypothetical protein